MKTIPLTRGLVAVVDDEDWYRLVGYSWRAHKDSRTGEYRAIRSLRRVSGRRPCSYMSREVVGMIPDGLLVDHINHNTLDNRRENLSLVSNSQNNTNRRKIRRLSSSFKGVYFHKASGKWIARITFNGKISYLGLHDNEMSAAIAYDNASKLKHGSFGLTNRVCR